MLWEFWGLCKLWNILNISKLFWTCDSCDLRPFTRPPPPPPIEMLPERWYLCILRLDCTMLKWQHWKYHSWNEFPNHVASFWTPVRQSMILSPSYLCVLSINMFVCNCLHQSQEMTWKPQKATWSIWWDWHWLTGVQWASLSKDVLFPSGFTLLTWNRRTFYLAGAWARSCTLSILESCIRRSHWNSPVKCEEIELTGVILMKFLIYV